MHDWVLISAITGFYLALVLLVGLRARVGARRRGYLTQAELFEDQFSSPLLATLMALIGVVVVVPYLTIQSPG